MSLILLGSFLCVISAAFAFGIAAFPVNPEHVRGDHLQTMAATLFWGIVAIIGFGMFKLDSLRPLRGGTGTLARLSRVLESGTPLALRLVAIAVIAVIVVSGAVRVLAIGRRNMNPDLTGDSYYPILKGAEWIRAHEPLDRVIMANEPEFVFHYSQHPTVWFPPISDSRVLMEGIRRHHIGAILVVHQAQSYWLPPEDACFQSLLRAYPSQFHLTHRDQDHWVYDVATLDGSN